MLTSYSSQKDEHRGKTTDPNRGEKYRKYVCEIAVFVPCHPRSYCHYNFMERRPNMNKPDRSLSCFVEYSPSPTPSPNASKTEGRILRKRSFYSHENVLYVPVPTRYTSKHVAYNSPGTVNPAE